MPFAPWAAFAKDEKCQFMLVCGDAFESNQVDRKTIARALEALKDKQYSGSKYRAIREEKKG